MMRALVLGGNRYIGLHLVRELARRGFDVTVLNSHEVPLPDGVRRLHGDRQQPGVITEVLGPHRDEFDVVYDNTSYWPKDIAPLVDLFQGRIEHYVFTSSVAAYRRSFLQPIDETFRSHDPTDTAPVKSYGVGKVQCERYLAERHERHGLPWTALRVGHSIGPMSPLPSREPIFFARLEAGRPILIPGDGLPFVHLVHVADVAALMAAVAGNPRAIGQMYNVVGREITSVLGSMRMMAAAAGVEPNIVNVPTDIARKLRAPLIHWGEALNGGLIFSIDKALRDLDWEPRWGLEAGYRDSYRWWSTEGRDRYEYDFSLDDEVLAQLGR
ncbi:MAG: NAD-dependent epimerase/dehydratase family protein [Ilumatobacteraceae bacterium]